MPYLGNDEKQFVKFGRVFVVISLVATVVIILLYISGWAGVSAHQTTEGDDGLKVNRLGGYPRIWCICLQHFIRILYVFDCVFSRS